MNDTIAWELSPHPFGLKRNDKMKMENEKSNIKWTFPKGQEWVGVVLTLALITLGFVVIHKHHKKEGFWYGFGAVLLLTAFVLTPKGGSGLGTTLFSYRAGTATKEPGTGAETSIGPNTSN